MFYEMFFFFWFLLQIKNIVINAHQEFSTEFNEALGFNLNFLPKMRIEFFETQNWLCRFSATVLNQENFLSYPKFVELLTSSFPSNK